MIEGPFCFFLLPLIKWAWPPKFEKIKLANGSQIPLLGKKQRKQTRKREACRRQNQRGQNQESDHYEVNKDQPCRRIWRH